MIMLRRLSLLSLASLLAAASACIVVDDDGGSDSANDTGNNTSGNNTSGNNTSGNNTSGNASGDTAAASTTSTEETAANDETAGGGACGWGATGDPRVPEGYVCNGDGPDPDGMFEMACPEGVTLEAGGDCGDIPGPGCCGPEGNAWFCGDAGDGPVLAQIEC